MHVQCYRHKSALKSCLPTAAAAAVLRNPAVDTVEERILAVAAVGSLVVVDTLPSRFACCRNR